MASEASATPEAPASSDAPEVPDERWLVAGLGNAGRWFRGTRHNAGFAVVEHLAAAAGARFRFAGARCRVAEVVIGGRSVVLAKPLWTVNQSGAGVAAVARAHGVPVTRLVVVQDDLDFPFGTVRLKRGGGAGGHNGVRSVSEALGARDYLRLRFGVGRPAAGQTMGRFVLGGFTAAERERIPGLLADCAVAVETLIGYGVDRAQNALHAPV